MTMYERIMSGKLFTDMCEGLPEQRLQGKLRMKQFNDSSPADFAGRVEMMREMFGQGEKIWVEPPIYFVYGKHIFIGEGSYINVNCNFVDDGRIEIGKNVLFGPAVTIATVGHPINPAMREYMYADTVRICDNVWVGGGAIICPGVTIGENSVIGAGSVVTKDVPANCVAAGNPCKVLREINDHDREFYYKDRRIDAEDLKEEAALRNTVK
ncbi:MAG: galactoside O-acetyltransferase [Acetatifactor sp.]|nr:galactoside O-acetyltransferase [Acetatifactor sp.]